VIELDLQSRVAPLFPAALLAVLALIVARGVELPFGIFLSVAVILLALAWWHERGRPLWFLGMVFIAFFAYGQVHFHRVAPDSWAMLPDFHRHTVMVRFEVVEEPKERNERWSFPARIRAIRGEEGWEACSGGFLGRLDTDAEQSLQFGDVVEGPVYLSRAQPPGNPSSFDRRLFDWVRYYDYHGTLPGKGWTILSRGEGDAFTGAAIALRRHMRHLLQMGLGADSEAGALMAAMLFGERDGLSRERIREFEVTGTLHLFAVSGQNIQHIMFVLMVFLYAFGVVRWRWAWLTIAPLLLFVASTGMESSAVRAFMMAALAMMAGLVYRPVHALNVVAGAALILLVFDPRQVFDLGFQFSFLVVIGLILIGPSVYGRIYALGKPDDYLPRKYLPIWRIKLDRVWKGVAGLAATSLVAWMASTPLTLLEFRLFSPIACIANFLVVPLATGVLFLSLASVVGGTLVMALAVGINQISALLLQAMVALTSFLASIPHGHQFVSPLPVPPPEVVRVVVPSGRGSLTAWVESGGRTILLGPGHARDWRFAVEPCRRFLGLDRVDHLVLTGANSAAMGAFADVVRQTRVRECIAGEWESRSPAWKAWLESDWSGVAIPVASGLGEPGWEWQEGMLQRVWSVEDVSLIYQLKDGDNALLYVRNPGAETYAVLIEETLQGDILLLDPAERQHPIDPDLLASSGARLIVLPRPGYASGPVFHDAFWAAADRHNVAVLRQEETGALWMESGPEQLRVRAHLPDGRFRDWLSIRKRESTE